MIPPHRFLLPLLLLIGAASPLLADSLDVALTRAGANRKALESALEEVGSTVRPHLAWLIEGMNDRDLRSLDTPFLVEHATIAHQSWRDAPWNSQVSESVFREAILPYASVDERRDRWRADFRERFLPVVKDAKSAGEAAALLNQTIFGTLNVRYSTQRPKANQSPYESMEAGLASCTGLSILLIDACRAVGIPARFVGTPLWSDGSGNHSWVEVWDQGRWRFTGAAEPSGNDLDKGWFSGRAATAKRDDPRYAIYATTWRRTPNHFPMVWSPEDRTVSAVNVTDRYTRNAVSVAEGSVRVRIRARNGAGQRQAVPFRVVAIESGETVANERTRDEGFDANDHATVILPQRKRYRLEFLGAVRAAKREFVAANDEMLIDVAVTPLDPVGSLRSQLLSSPTDRTYDAGWASVALSKEQAREARKLLAEDYSSRVRLTRLEEIESEEITIDGKTLRYATHTYGTRPANGWSLWISLHGGGGTTPAVNDQQWENQKRLYTPEEGIYLAPRAPTNTWNLWHQAHIDGLFDRLIENCLHLEGVDPNRVYLLGYSAGGDGVYQLAPRLADRFAAAAMMAGHPNDARPEGLRNLPFTLHMGANDSAYSRNKVAATWKTRLAELKESDPEGYPHWVEIHEGKGHWMDRDDAAAIPWMAKSTRNPFPKRVVWVQDDVTHPRFYWLANPAPARGATITATLTGQEIELSAVNAVGTIHIRLNDAMLDLDRPVRVVRGEELLFEGKVPRTIETLAKTLEERGDRTAVWSAELVVPLGAVPSSEK